MVSRVFTTTVPSSMEPPLPSPVPWSPQEHHDSSGIPRYAPSPDMCSLGPKISGNEFGKIVFLGGTQRLGGDKSQRGPEVEKREA